MEDRLFALEILSLLVNKTDYEMLSNYASTEDLKRACLEIVETKVFGIEYLVARLEQIDKVKASKKRIINWDMGAINKAFNESMNKHYQATTR